MVKSKKQEDEKMLSYTKEEVKKMAAQAAEVEIYRFNQADRYIRGIHKSLRQETTRSLAAWRNGASFLV